MPLKAIERLQVFGQDAQSARVLALKKACILIGLGPAFWPNGRRIQMRPRLSVASSRCRVELSYDHLAGASDNGVPNLLAVTSPPYHLLRRILDNTTAACFRSADLYPRNRVDPSALLAAAKGPTSGHSAGQASIAALCRNRPLTLWRQAAGFEPEADPRHQLRESSHDARLWENSDVQFARRKSFSTSSI